MHEPAVRLEPHSHHFTCPISLLDTVKLEDCLSSGSTSGPSYLLLVCYVSGFYPKPVWVMWMQGEQEQLDTWQGDVLLSADRTWYLRVTLDVLPGEAAGLNC